MDWKMHCGADIDRDKYYCVVYIKKIDRYYKYKLWILYNSYFNEFLKSKSFDYGTFPEEWFDEFYEKYKDLSIEEKIFDTQFECLDYIYKKYGSKK